MRRGWRCAVAGLFLLVVGTATAKTAKTALRTVQASQATTPTGQHSRKTRGGFESLVFKNQQRQQHQRQLEAPSLSGLSLLRKKKTVLKERRLHHRLAVRGGGGAASPGGDLVGPLALPLARRVVGLLGGTLTHLVLGSFYCVPNLASYMPREMQYLSRSGRTENGGGKPDALLAIPLILLSAAATMPIGADLATKISPALSSAIGGLCATLGVFLASRSTECWHFLLTHGILFGVGFGFGYTAPMVASYKAFPRNRGLVTGTVLVGFGAAATVWNPVVTRLANPDNHPPPYPESISRRFAPAVRALAAAYALVSTCGVLAIAYGGGLRSAPATTTTKASVVVKTALEESSRVAALKTPAFWSLWLLCCLAAAASLNVASLWKSFAMAEASETLRTNDRVLAAAGAMASFWNGLGRFSWATLSDIFGVGRTFATLLAIQTVSMASLARAVTSPFPTLFAANLAAVFFCLGGVFSLGPPLASKLFGPTVGPQVYGLLFSAFPVASIGGQLLAARVIPLLGWRPLFDGLALVSGLSFAPLFALKQLW